MIQGELLWIGMRILFPWTTRSISIALTSLWILGELLSTWRPAWDLCVGVKLICGLHFLAFLCNQQCWAGANVRRARPFDFTLDCRGDDVLISNWGYWGERLWPVCCGKPQSELLFGLLFIGQEKERGFCIPALQMKPSMTGNLDRCVAFPLSTDVLVLALAGWTVVSFTQDVGQA